MTEFDFDELDRAVNNLMSDVDTSKRSEAFDDPAEKTVELQVTPDEPVLDSVTPAAAQPLAVTRRGRFMDVVRPSVDMKSANIGMPKRQGIAVETPSAEPVNTENLTPAVDQSNSSDTTPRNDNVSMASDMPSPEESHESVNVEMNDSSENQSSDAMQAEIPQESSDDSQNDTELPMESPFLSDAVVEKRPLGTPAEVGENDELLLTATSMPDESTEASQPVEDAPVAEPVSQELTPEIMNIESDQISQPTPERDAVEPVIAQVPVQPQGTAPTDIVPQYTESESQNKEPSGAIYDTATYHQPLEHPAKKHSGWGIIVWVLLLLIVGAVAGAAYFYFTTQY